MTKKCFIPIKFFWQTAQICVWRDFVSGNPTGSDPATGVVAGGIFASDHHTLMCFANWERGDRLCDFLSEYVKERDAGESMLKHVKIFLSRYCEQNENVISCS